MIKPKKLLLIDSLGAFVSAIMLGIVLVYTQEYIGMPKNILYLLATFAACFMIFSFSSFFRKSVDPKKSLMVIGILNTLYCIVSLILVFYYYNQLTVIGIIYFLIEKLIVLPLAFIELQTAQN